MMTTPLSPSTTGGVEGEGEGEGEGKLPPQRLDTVFGVMGGYMQPQGHVQVLLNILAFGMSPQEALDAPRFCVGSNYTGSGGGKGGVPGSDGEVLVKVEVGVEESVVVGLRRLGYVVVVAGESSGKDRHVFGRGQVVRNGGEGEAHGGRVWCGGSDMRGDGGCVGY